MAQDPEKRTFYCPYCHEKLSFLGGTIIKMDGVLHADTFTVRTQFFFPAEFGKYGVIISGPVEIREGTKVEFHCINPTCNKNYTAAYNLSDTLQKFLMMPIALAVQPMYMRLWADHGEEATKAFLGKAGAFFALVATPAVFGVIAVRAPLLTLLAGEAYSDGIDVIPLAFGGYVIYGSYTVLAAGLFIHRRTGRLAIATACACVVNLGLNRVLIPRMGIVGAAIATAISYIGLMLVLTFMSFRSLRFPLPWGYILRVVGFGAVMFLSITWIDLGHPAATLAARIVLGAFVFCSLALGVDSRGRRLVQEILRPG